MNYLNNLGANVRNHMSTIEDKFVEQARKDFPVAQKASRIPPLKPSGGETTAPVKPESKEIVPKKEPAREVKQPGNVNPPRPAEKPISKAGKVEQRPIPREDTRPVPSRETPVQHREPRPAPPKQNFGEKPVQKPVQKPAPSQVQNRSSEQGRPIKQANQVSARPAGERAGQHPVNRANQDFRKSDQPRTTAPHQTQPNGHQKPANNNFAQKNASGRPGGGPVARPQYNAPGKFPSRHGSQPVKPKQTGPATNVKSVQLPESMTVKDFSQLIELAAGDVIKKLMTLGVMSSINQEIDRDTMILIADEYGITATAAKTEQEKLQVEEIEDDPKSLVTRPPVVTIMGHVDHGKTSLLDVIRETNVTAQEAGGITQHIGAYQVELNDRKITFLDTPGHAAFTAMRARGAQATDIAILVVAADDGVMPQTIEALNHAKDANVPIIVAINKMDKPGANPERIKQDLTVYGLVSEEWGGDTIFVPVSAKKREGIETLLEMILLVADMKDLKANPDRTAKGTIVEAQLDKGRGPVATVLVQNGTLHIGDSIIAGAAVGRVKVLINDKGKRVKKAGPSTPVEVIGFDEVPEAGDIMYSFSEERQARELADKRMQFKRETELKKNQKVTLDDLFTKIKEGEIKEIKVIIKADVQGSVEAIRQSLEQLTNQDVRVMVIHGGVGGIGEGDVMFASASNAIIIGFNVRPDPIAKRLAEKENVDIRLYRIIYNIIEDVQKAMEGLLEPEYREVVQGRAEVRVVYKVPKVGNIGGCYVTEGKIIRNSDVRVIRDNIVIHEGKIGSLKRFKDDAREVAEGFECGIGLEKFNDIKEGDIIESYTMEEVKRAASK